MVTAFDAWGPLVGTNDWELFNRWLEGSPAAGLALLEKYQLAWRRYLRKRYGADWEDIFQQAMLACVEGQRNFRMEGNFGSYVFGILRNQISGERRRRIRERQLADALRVQSFDVRETQSDEGEASVAVQVALDSLPSELRDVLIMRFVSKMTRERVALALSVPAGTVASRERRAKAKLFGLLASSLSADGET